MGSYGYIVDLAAYDGNGGSSTPYKQSLLLLVLM